MLVLSLFPGIDLLGRGFEAEGYCVVRGPDLIFGQDIRAFKAVPEKFEGVIAGSPCQDFSSARRSPPTGYGLEMMREFERIVREAYPLWFLLENVPAAPAVSVPGYTLQRVDLSAAQCGGRQLRLRQFQFGYRDNKPLVLDRDPPSVGYDRGVTEAAAIACEGQRQTRRSFADFCDIQGLPRSFSLPGWSQKFKYAAVGNGVPVYMARVIARGICDRALSHNSGVRLCACDCARVARGRAVTATAACRKRLQRRRREKFCPLRAKKSLP